MKYVKLFASVIVFATAAWRPAFGSSISTNGLTLVDLTTDDPDHCTGTTSGYFSGSGIQYAFNNDETLGERWALQNYRQGYVIYRFDTPTVVNGYGIWNHAGANTEPTKRAPRTWTFEAPVAFVVGDRKIEFPCRVEENEFMVASMRKLGRGDVSFWEFPGRDHGAVEGPANAVIRDFIRRTTIASR